MRRKKLATKALLKDLKEVFDKHDLPAPLSVATASETLPASPSASPPDPCPPGKRLEEVSITLEDGTIITMKVCR